MLREEDVVTAIMAYRQGHKGYVLVEADDKDRRRMTSLEDAFSDLDTFRYLVEWDLPETHIGGVETTQEDTEAAAPEEVTELEVTAQIAEEAPKKKTDKTRRSREEVEQLILKAWNGGEHSISEIMKITGCTHATVRRYIPISPNG